MTTGLQLSTVSVARLLAQIFGPSYWDSPVFGWGSHQYRGILDRATLVVGPHPEPWREAGLNPQPPPLLRLRDAYAFALADAHIGELLALDRIGAMFGGEVAERTLERSLRHAAEIEELCPRWHRWPKGWPAPPPPPWQDETMTATELFAFGIRFVAAAEQIEQERLQQAFVGVGEKALGLSMRG